MIEQNVIAQPPNPQREAKFEFEGNAKEYFGIWIVNVLLTIVTLGIYSAWAKVRRNRYFYGNTVLDGHAFEYHAEPKQILIGRIIVFAFFIAYNVLANISPVTSGIALIIFLAVVPFAVARGLRFAARVTSYRNVRFDFVGKPGGAFVAYVVGPLLSILSIGILVPLASRWTARYTLGHLKYGDRSFESDPHIKDFYRVWAVPLLLLVVISVFGGFAFYTFVLSDGASNSIASAGLIAIIYLALFGFFIVAGLASVIYAAGARNVTYNALTLDKRHGFRSTLDTAKYTWIVVSNVVATIVTLGLLRPWAAVRMAKYLSKETSMLIAGDLDAYVGQIKEETGVIGSEFMDMEGIDVGF